MSASLLRLLRIHCIGLHGIIASTVLALALLGAPASWAQTFDEARAAYSRGEYAIALKLFRTLAEQGHDLAQSTLWVNYILGIAVPQDDIEAARWARWEAERGDDWAQFRLGAMYHQGKGVPQDYAEAVRWYRLAAEQGEARAQHNLGLMHISGRGVLQDYVQAHKWLNLAASRYSSAEQELRDRAVQFREGVASKMTPAQVAEAQWLAREWKPVH